MKYEYDKNTLGEKCKISDKNVTTPLALLHSIIHTLDPIEE
jgi:hypothetical protein